MTLTPLSSSIISTETWMAEPVVRLPFVGWISFEVIRQFASRLAFILLLTAAGILLVHPGDLVPQLNDLPLYQVLVSTCLLLELPSVIAKLRPSALRANAINCLILLLVVAAAVSPLAHGNVYDARMAIAVVAKVAVLYLLVLALVDSPSRLRITLGMIVAFVLAMTVIAILQYHGVIHLPGLGHVERHSIDPATSQATVQVRLCGIGLFNDPNDLSLVLVTSIIVCGYFLTSHREKSSAAWLLLAPLLLFAYALYLTHSRGGMVSAAAGLLVFLCTRIGVRNALALASLVLPLLFILGPWGRAAEVDLENPEDTFQTRLDLWSESYDAFRSAPLTGIGQGKIVDEIGQVTHNSYLQAYAEMGLLGGTAFVGAFYLVLRGLWRAEPKDRELAQMQPYLLALMAAYAQGLLSLSRCYHAPTLLLLGIGTTYLVMSSRSGASGLSPMNGATLRRITGVGTLFLAATYVFLRLMLQRGAA